MTGSNTLTRRIDPVPGLIAAALIFFIYAGVAVSVDFSRSAFGFHSDEATYYMMGHSLVADGDLAYRREDLDRVYREFPSGPSGAFLKKGRDLDIRFGGSFPFVEISSVPDPDPARLFFGKSYVYAFVAAPFVALFGTNGFLLLNAVLLAVLMLVGYMFLNARSSPLVSVLLAAGFLMASAAPAYFVWITPELLNLALVMLGYFCWVYKDVVDPAAAPRGTQWLLTDRSDLLASVFLGFATFSKPSNVLLILPMLVWLGVRKRWVPMLASGSVFAATGALLLAGGITIAGEWNFQGGERRTFYENFPFHDNKVQWDVIGQNKRTDSVNVPLDRRVLATVVSYDLYYFMLGRYSGMLPYFFPGVFAVGAFLLARRRRRPWQWLVLAAAAGEVVLLILWIPDNYFGGGGAVGNRYLMSFYGMFLFLLPPIESVAAAILPWAVGGLFSGAVVLNPFFASFNPAEHGKQGPVRLLPVELTLVNDLPVNTRPERVRVWFGAQRRFQIYFLDENAYGREDLSFWTRGESRAEILVKTAEPASGLELTLQAGPKATAVTVARGWSKIRVELQPEETRTITVPLDEGFPYSGTRVWHLSVSTEEGFVPATVTAASADRRFLGVRVTPELTN